MPPAGAIEAKDIYTRSHSERVAKLAERLALTLAWTTKRARALHTSALLHDVGKIGIPDTILLKPGRLTPDEYEQLKRHAEIGAYIAAEVLEDEQVTWIRGHHERWDGTGYPDQLHGEQIPQGAQLLALADAWDVMTEARSYKATKSIEDALIDCQTPNRPAIRTRRRRRAPDPGRRRATRRTLAGCNTQCLSIGQAQHDDPANRGATHTFA